MLGRGRKRRLKDNEYWKEEAKERGSGEEDRIKRLDGEEI